MKKKILLIVMAVAVMWNISGCGKNHGTTDGGDTVSSSENDVEETGETLPLGPGKEFGNVSFQDNWWLLPAVYDGKMYMDSYSYKEDEEVLYQIDIEKWEARKVYTYEDEDNLPEVIGTRGDLICLNADTEAHNDETKIVCFNTESDTKTIVTGEEISAVLEKEGLWEEGCKKKRWHVDEDASFSYGDRIYMLIHMSWFRKGTMKKWGEKGKTKVKRFLILSCPWDNIKEVTYEKEISEWWYNRAGRNTDWGEYDYFEEYSAGGILTLYNDELYVHYLDEDYHIAAYHMGTGTWRELDEWEAEYRLMDWSWDDGAMDD